MSISRFFVLVVVFTSVFYANSRHFFPSVHAQDTAEGTLTILNPHEHPKTGNIWQINFTTQSGGVGDSVGSNTLSIIPADIPSQTEIEFKGLYCGDTLLPTPTALMGNIYVYQNYTCEQLSHVNYLVHTAGDHAITIQYGKNKQTAYNSGIFQWSERLGSGYSNTDIGYDVTINTDDSTILTGRVTGDADFNGDGDVTDPGGESSTGYGNSDIFISVFDSAYNFVWSERLGGTGFDYGYAITTDSNNNIIVTGYVTGDADLNGDGDVTDPGGESSTGYGNTDIFISVFDSSYNFVWSERLGGTGVDYGYDVITDSNNKIVLTGQISGAADLNGDGDKIDTNETATGYGQNDIFISAFNSSHVFVWSERLGRTGQDIGWGVAIGLNNNIIVTGQVSGTVDLNGDNDTLDTNENGFGYGSHDIFISVFNSSHVFVWSERLGSTTTDYGYAVTTDSNNNIIVTGRIGGDADLNGDGDRVDSGGEIVASPPSYTDIFISVFNSSHVFVWSERLEGTNTDIAYDVTTDLNDNIIITGEVAYFSDLNGDGDSSDPNESSLSSYSDIFVSVFNSAHNFLWSERLGSERVDAGYGVVTDSEDNIIIVGSVNGQFAADLNGDGDTSDPGGERPFAGSADDIFISVFAPDTVAPVKSNFNPESSATVRNSTPTITFDIDDLGNCYASFFDESYDDMADDINCTGDNTTSMSCALSDLGELGEKTVFIACTDNSGNKDTTETNEVLTYTYSLIPPTILDISPDSDSEIYDSTPTIRFATDTESACRLSTFDEAYDDMNDDVVCTTDDDLSHVCQTEDLGSNGEKNLYIACTDPYDNKHTAQNNVELLYTLATPDNPLFSDLILDSDTPLVGGVADAVYSIVSDGDYTYVGGSFSTYGPYVEDTAGAVVNKDTGRLSGLSIAKVIGEVKVSISDGDGGWYIGGDFSEVGDESIEYLAHINSDGSVDTEFVITFFDNPIFALALNGTDLYVGNENEYLVKINTQTSEIDENFTPAPDSSVYELLVIDGYLYVGGAFTEIGGLSRYGVARLDLDTGAADENFAISADYAEVYGGMSYSDSGLFLGGYFEYGADTYDLIKVNVDTGAIDGLFEIPEFTGYINDTAILGDYIYIGGSFNMVNGAGISNFVRLDSETGELDTNCSLTPFGEVSTLAVSGDSIYLGGYFYEISGQERTGVARVSAATCGLDTNFNPNIVNNYRVLTLSIYGSQIYIGGNFDGVSDGAANNLLKINSVTKEVVSDFIPDVISDISALVLNGEDLYVSLSRQIIKMDTGTGVIDGNFDVDIDDTIHSIIVANNSLYVGGEFFEVNGIERLGVAKLDLSTGEVDEDFNAHIYSDIGAVRSIVYSDSAIFLGGTILVAEGTAFGLLKVDAETGEVLDTFFDDSDLFTTFIHNDNLYIGGQFTFSDGEYYTNFARLNKDTGVIDTECKFDTHYDLGDSSVYAITLNGNVGYIGGYFTDILGDDGMYSLVRFDATTCEYDANWIPYPIYTVNDVDYPGYVRSLLASDEGLWVGGQFHQIAEEEVRNLAFFGFESNEDDEEEDDTDGLITDENKKYLKLKFSKVNGTEDDDFEDTEPDSEVQKVIVYSNKLELIFDRLNVKDTGVDIDYYTIRLQKTDELERPTGSFTTWVDNIDHKGKDHSEKLEKEGYSITYVDGKIRFKANNKPYRLDEGTYYLRVRAYDTAGNFVQSNRIKLVIMGESYPLVLTTIGVIPYEPDLYQTYYYTQPGVVFSGTAEGQGVLQIDNIDYPVTYVDGLWTHSANLTTGPHTITVGDSTFTLVIDPTGALFPESLRAVLGVNTQNGGTAGIVEENQGNNNENGDSGVPATNTSKADVADQQTQQNTETSFFTKLWNSISSLWD